MKIEPLTPDAIILQELGKRLTRIRKQHGRSQDSLAEEAGLGVATLRRIEAGEGSQLESWLKLLKALRMTSSIEALLPETFDSPMAEALSDNKRTRAPGAKGKRWGDEA